MGLKGSLEKAIKRLDDIEASASKIRGVEYIATAYFEGCELYCWVIDIFVRFILDDKSHNYIKVHSEGHSKQLMPQDIYNRLEELKQMFNVHTIDFDPKLWSWKEDGRWAKQ